jgi:hypothetical protein
MKRVLQKKQFGFKGFLPKSGVTILTTSNESINHFVRCKVLNLHN